MAASLPLRLDMALVERGLAPTRARARDAIRRGHVTVDGLPATKPAMTVKADAAITIDDPAGSYVSRGALKLIAGLERFGYSPEGRVALDLGASTGGFVQVLLERGARKVHAVDVGHGQLSGDIAGDPRVVSHEGLNARDLMATDLDGDVPEAITADVSFISLSLALPPALKLAAPGAWGVFLVKPQFEVGRELVGKGGLVRDRAAAEAAVERIAETIRVAGWTVDGAMPIAGRRGRRQRRVPDRGAGVSETVTIGGLGHSGDGIAETAGGARVFVPFTLPGETVEIERAGERGTAVRRLTDSAERVPPICRHFGTCGGCALQHMERGAYLAWKREQVAAAFRQRGIAAPVEPVAALSPGTRRRAVFSASADGGRA